MMKNSNKPRYNNNSAKQSAEPDTLPVYVKLPDGSLKEIARIPNEGIHNDEIFKAIKDAIAKVIDWWWGWKRNIVAPD